MNNKNLKFPSQFIYKILNIFNLKYGLDTKEYEKKYSLNSKEFIEPQIINKLFDELMSQKEDYEVLYLISKLNRPKDLGLLGYLILHSKNVYEALNILCTYYPLIGNKIKPVFIKENDYFKIVIYFIENEKILDMKISNAILHLFAIVNLINQILEEDIKPLYITFKQERLYELKDGSIGGIKCKFSQEEDAIFFHKDIISLPTVFSNKTLFKTYEKEAEKILALNLNGDILKEKISGFILVSIMQLDISLENVAKKMQLSPRVIQQRLKAENTSFSKILNDIRMKLAIYYINKNIDFSMVAIYLAYKDLSSFFRSFKKYYKLTPSQWKISNKEN